MSREAIWTERLLATAQANAADALHRCHRALDLDGHARCYTADEWLPIICEAAAPLLETARLDQEPPLLVRHTQEAVRLREIPPDDQESRGAAEAGGWSMIRLRRTLRLG